jgi:hypothetical protein
MKKTDLAHALAATGRYPMKAIGETQDGNSADDGRSCRPVGGVIYSWKPKKPTG